MMYAIECSYRREPMEVIAVFERRVDADRYASRHTNEGGGRLVVVECGHMILRFEIRAIVDGSDIPFGGWFRYRSEARAFAARNASIVRDKYHSGRRIRCCGRITVDDRLP